uniref:DUF3987 domain-containing protein n=1 Tax=Ascaris lumbricoides TaxID=6252 RepID=A0A0M3HQN4_ASCLU
MAALNHNLPYIIIGPSGTQILEQESQKVWEQVEAYNAWLCCTLKQVAFGTYGPQDILGIACRALILQAFIVSRPLGKITTATSFEGELHDSEGLMWYDELHEFRML